MTREFSGTDGMYVGTSKAWTLVGAIRDGECDGFLNELRAAVRKRGNAKDAETASVLRKDDLVRLRWFDDTGLPDYLDGATFKVRGLLHTASQGRRYAKLRVDAYANGMPVPRKRRYIIGAHLTVDARYVVLPDEIVEQRRAEALAEVEALRTQIKNRYRRAS